MPKKFTNINIRCEEDFKSAVEEVASENRRNTSDWIRMLIEPYVMRRMLVAGTNHGNESNVKQRKTS